MIKIKHGSMSSIISYKYDKSIYIGDHFKIGMFVYLVNNEITITNNLIDRAIGVVFDNIDGYVDVFCGNGIIETDFYGDGSGHKYIIGEELSVNVYNSWGPKKSAGDISYGKCLSFDYGILEIETYFGDLNIVPAGEKIYSGGVCKMCKIYNEYQDVEYICWSCSYK